VLSNKAFRDLKLSRSKNPIVNQFWKEIATQGRRRGLAREHRPVHHEQVRRLHRNDFMRPIIGQQESSFKFREVIDRRRSCS
jgi:hypothetical protein